LKERQHAWQKCTRAWEDYERETEKTTESIRKKHRALKIGKIEEDIAIKSYFKPIIEPLQKIVDNSSMRAIKDERDDDVDSMETSSVPKSDDSSRSCMLHRQQIFREDAS